MNFKQWLIKESSEITEIFQDANKNRYKIIKIQNGYQAYYSQHDDDEIELELEDVKYTPHLDLIRYKSTTSAALIRNVQSEMQNLNDMMNQPELIEELPAQIQNTMQHVQILAEYLEITESKLSSYQPRIAAVTTAIRDLRNTSLQAMQIADSLEEDKVRRTFKGSTSDKESLKELSILMPRIHEQVNKIHKSMETDESHTTLTASIGITYESYELPDSTRNKACAFNSVSIYEDHIQEIQNPTEQEMISILKSIMEDERTLDYIESIVARKCR